MFSKCEEETESVMREYTKHFETNDNRTFYTQDHKKRQTSDVFYIGVYVIHILGPLRWIRIYRKILDLYFNDTSSGERRGGRQKYSKIHAHTQSDWGLNTCEGSKHGESQNEYEHTQNTE